MGRVLALLAMLLSQPLTAVHAALDEEHLFPASLVELTIAARAAHGEAGHSHGHGSDSDSFHHQTCTVCLLVGAAVKPAGSTKAAHSAAPQPMARPSIIEATTAEKRLRVGDPVRAPPRMHLI